MNKKHFAEMLDSLGEAVEVGRGERKPSRAYTLTEPDVRATRRCLSLTRVEFATLLNASMATIQGNEQVQSSPKALKPSALSAME